MTDHSLIVQEIAREGVGPWTTRQHGGVFADLNTLECDVLDLLAAAPETFESLAFQLGRNRDYLTNISTTQRAMKRLNRRGLIEQVEEGQFPLPWYLTELGETPFA